MSRSRGGLALAAALMWTPAVAGTLEDWVRAKIAVQRSPSGAAPTGANAVIWHERAGTGDAAIADFVAPSSLAPLVRTVRPAVVNISTNSGGTSRSLGSGFVINADGLVVTNNHVVDRAEVITVRLADGREFQAELTGRDPETDLALLRLRGASQLPTVKLGDSDALEIGDWIVAIGNPFGLDTSVTHGLISARERVIGMGPWDDFLQTNALINPGNSGGPLFDMRGDVVGMATAVLSRAQGIGFAVPINLVKELLPNLLDNGRVVRGWVGISAQEITEGGIRVPVVTDVFRGSPAQDGGVLTGDRVVLINGKPIERYQTLLRRIALQAPGTKLTLGLRRAGRPLEVRVTLASRPVETAIKAMVSGGRIDSLGLTLRELDVEEVRRAGLERSLRIEAISPGGPADLAGLSAGDLLLEVNRQPVGTLGEVSAAWGAKGSAVFVKVKRGDVARYVSLAPEPQ